MTGRRDFGRDLMRVAAAVVGTAAAAQVVEPVGAELAEEIERGFWRIATDAGVTVADVQDSTCDITGRSPEIAQVRHVLRAMVAAGKATATATEFSYFPIWPEPVQAQAAPAEPETAAMDVHAALNTYEVATDVAPGVERINPATVLVIGVNHRRLVLRRDPDGVWIGGCLVAPGDELVLAGYLAEWAGQR